MIPNPTYMPHEGPGAIDFVDPPSGWNPDEGPIGNYPPTPTDPPDPPVTHPTPSPPPPPPTTPKDPVDRLADLLERMFGQQIALPAPGRPQLIPQATTSGGLLPILLIVGGLGIIGYMIYQRKKKGDAHAGPA